MGETMSAFVQSFGFVFGALTVGFITGWMFRGPRNTPEPLTIAQPSAPDESPLVKDLLAKIESQEDEGLRWLASHRELESQVSEAKKAAEDAKGKEALEDAAAEIAGLNEKLKEIDSLHGDVDSARGRSAELERKLAEALAGTSDSGSGGHELEAARQQVGVLTGQLANARDRASQLETQLETRN